MVRPNAFGVGFVEVLAHCDTSVFDVMRDYGVGAVREAVEFVHEVYLRLTRASTGVPRGS